MQVLTLSYACAEHFLVSIKLKSDKRAAVILPLWGCDAIGRHTSLFDGL